MTFSPVFGLLLLKENEFLTANKRKENDFFFFYAENYIWQPKINNDLAWIQKYIFSSHDHEEIVKLLQKIYWFKAGKSCIKTVITQEKSVFTQNFMQLKSFGKQLSAKFSCGFFCESPVVFHVVPPWFY